MKILYFAWLRTRTGVAEETLDPSPGPCTVGRLIEHLKARSAGHASAFETLSVVRVAVNQDYAGLETVVAADDEVAFFPPVTGG